MSMKVLFVSRIGLSEGDLEKYMEDAIGAEFELAEWLAYFKINALKLIRISQ